MKAKTKKRKAVRKSMSAIAKVYKELGIKRSVIRQYIAERSASPVSQ